MGTIWNHIKFWTFILNRALTQMKIRLKGAEKGHSLLKKKSDALTLRFRQILAKIIEVTDGLLLEYRLCH